MFDVTADSDSCSSVKLAFFNTRYSAILLYYYNTIQYNNNRVNDFKSKGNNHPKKAGRKVCFRLRHGASEWNKLIQFQLGESDKHNRDKTKSEFRCCCTKVFFVCISSFVACDVVVCIENLV